MALYITHPRAEELAGLLAEMHHAETVRVVIDALEEKYSRDMQRVAHKLPHDIEVEELRAFTHAMFNGPDLDHRTVDEIIGYDENGLPA